MQLSVPGVSLSTLELAAPFSVPTWIPLDANQAFSYRWTSAPASPNGLYVDVLGYLDRR
jgi:hypothetical protein